MSRPYLGDYADGSRAIIDLPRLLETRMLIQAASGFGKSFAVRRLLEQTAGHVQQLVIDPDGEYATLREKHDFIIAAAHDGDALAHPKTAALLARRLLETGVSAILDIYDLKPHERHSFVRIFLQTLVDAPKSLWHPVLTVVDEAHVWAPQVGESEAAAAVIDLATRGRKRGFGIVLASQRLSKLHKDVAAECLNKLIGRAGLDIDVKRAADDLGMSHRDATEQLRKLQPGEFFAYGPALCPDVQKLKVGAVQTTHPKAGERSLAPPPKPTAAIKAVLPQLADLPKEAEQEAKSLADLKADLAQARRELTQAKNAKPGASSADLKAAQDQGRAQGYELAIKAHNGYVGRVEAWLERYPKPETTALPQRPAFTPRVPSPALGKPAVSVQRPAPSSGNGAAGVTTPQQKLLDKLAWLESHDLHPAPKETLAAVADVSPTSGGYFNNLGSLRSAGLIEYPTPGMVGFTAEGRAVANPSDDDRPVHEHWYGVVTAPQKAILEALVAQHPEPIAKDDLAAQISVSPTSGGYFNNLGRLRTLGAIDYPQKGHVALTRHVMP